MSDQESFSKEDVGKIFSEASRIQVEKDLGLNQKGLNVDDLIQVASELGIDPDSLLQAISNKNYELDQEYSWLKGTAEIQQIFTIDGQFKEEHLSSIIRELKMITGKKGTTHTTGTTFEWSNEENEVGHIHVALSNNGEKAQLQMLSSWKSLKLLGNVLSVMAGSLLILISFKELYWKELAMLVAPLGGLLGFTINRFFMNRYFKKQKIRLKKIAQAVRAIITPAQSPSIFVDEDTGESDVSNTTSSSEKLKN